ncbi:MarR family winged helix-turn-helix transcriptional regulator [Paenibacillus oleatilyticus]|uniref:MarR family winged helix-turn-helix transcriptional regulator n=1 Tax=Paenibacillus oleatilyticus TaxID=2594886 RepID=UPI001C1FD429|nr:MarR family transcriptional regulator [Paenibacillus oleatilyticus]MBU7318196.1 MarR family transcriptional regulator [Paenibacillus oleatilyticus]
MKEPSLETIELEMAILFRRMTSITNKKRFGNLDRSAYLLLHQISSHGSAGVKTLADEFHLDISTVSRQAAALEAKGYVYRIPDPSDGRAYSLQITELGARELLEYKEARLARFTELLKHWSEEECSAFGQLLQKFNRTFLEPEGTPKRDNGGGS